MHVYAAARASSENRRRRSQGKDRRSDHEFRSIHKRLLARLDRKRKKKASNDDWTHLHDPDAKITKMKDGRTHLAHRAEHAVDLETGAIDRVLWAVIEEAFALIWPRGGRPAKDARSRLPTRACA